MPIGPWELIILVLVILLVFGARRLPEIGRGLGKGMREFKDAVTGKEERAAQGHAPAEIRTTVAEENEPVASSSSERERERSA
ncbi:MAG: twin-arginine translocase TatA/TatE family subunit [Thermoleophilia bacterium]